MKGQYFFFLLKTFIYYLIDLHLCKKNWHEIGISNVFAFGMIEYETLFDDTQTYSSSLILRNYFVILECHWKWIFFCGEKDEIAVMFFQIEFLWVSLVLNVLTSVVDRIGLSLGLNRFGLAENF